MTEVDERPYSERFATPKKGEYQFDKVPLDDPRVYAMIGSGRTQGCFQIESKLGKDWSSGIKPTNPDEISDLIALIRPGCLESGMTETYKEVKKGNQEVSYYHPALEPILKSTKGVLVYQEQTIRIAKDLAGFSEQEADGLRRAMGKKDVESMLKIQDVFVTKAKEYGVVTEDQAKEIFSWILKSARYNFNKSHSVSYGITTYNTTYAKVHYPTEFFCAYLMFSDLKPDPKEEIYTIVNEAKSFGINIVTPSVILLNKDFKITKPKEIAFGLYHIRDVGESAINRLLELGEKIKTPMGFLKNITEIGRKSAEALVKAGACDTWGIERMSLLKFINVVYGYSSKEADKNLNLKHLSKKELDYFDEHFNEIGENLMTSLIGMLNKIIEDKACMTKRVEVIRNKIEQCKNCGQDTNLVKSAWEKVYLGINISCSAADDIIANDGLTCKKIFDYEPENYKTEKFKVYCTIDKVHNKITGEKSKNPGQEYCYVDISDSTLALPGIVCWPEQYQKFKDSINEGALACVTGRWTRYKDSKQFTLLEIQEISA